MKRNVNLIELSRDHHFGLLLGWKVKQGIKRGVEPAEIARYIIFFSEHALFPHFQQEEEQLLTFLDEADEKRIQTLSEHAQIRTLISVIRNNPPDTAQLTELAQLVESHIRFEERELFPYMESLLSHSELEEIGEMIRNAHEPYIENYPNEFWTKTH